jgi:peptidoglycan/xylan/chitin deacetylase (PgdA/CDA1 family)/glycosyltransferase involved in cell wall biosynthesis
MRILHVLSQIFISGPEFYVAALAEEHSALGHEIFVVSDALTADVRGKFTSRPIADRSYPARLRNICFLRKFIRRNRVDVVHAHSRAASWVSYFAALWTGVPLISTVHGRQFPHLSARLFDVYGDRVIAVCENLREHLVNELGMSPAKIALIRNGFDFALGGEDKGADRRGGGGDAELGRASRRPGGSPGMRDAETEREKKIAIIGRTNGPKGRNIVKLADNVLRPLLAAREDIRAIILGGDVAELPGDGHSRVIRIAEDTGGRLETPGFVDDLHRAIADMDIVIAAGRVAVEALFLGKPVLAVGEDLSHGLITEANLEDAMSSNFGDISPVSKRTEPDYNLLRAQIEQVLASPPDADPLRSRIAREYDIREVSGEILTLYESVRMKRLHSRHIPVLMYHKIPDRPFETRHRIFVTKSDFRKHLEYFRAKAMSPITFRDYLEFASGRKDMRDFPRRPIILTFDDGYRDNSVNLLPMMSEFGYTGVLFLLGDASADYNFWDADGGDHRDALMTLDEKKGFVDAGWEIGAHSMTHPDLTSLDDEQARWEIEESKRRLESDLHAEVVSFAYPGGKVDERLKRLVREAGFSFGISTDAGGLHIEDDRFQIFRVNMFPHDKRFQMLKKSSSWYRKYYKWKRGK